MSPPQRRAFCDAGPSRRPLDAIADYEVANVVVETRAASDVICTLRGRGRRRDSHIAREIEQKVVGAMKMFGLSVAVVFGIMLVACGSATRTPKGTAVPSSVTALQTDLADATADPSIAAGYATPAVAVSDSSGGRRILTDTSGLTLYVFSDDVPATGMSNCTGECASTWPPLTVPYGLGFQIPGMGLFGEFRRDDGNRQVMYRGRPLYRYSGDTAPGDTNGDGKDGRWSVAVP